MSNIAMVDLVSQYQHIAEEITSRFDEICKSAAFIGGKYVKSFQEDLQTYLDVKHVIPCANGTDALQIALMALDLEPGDEIITTSFTFVATAEVIALLQLEPVFAEIDPVTFNIDPYSIQDLINSHTKCIIPVHLFGQSANMEAIMELANLHDIPVIEDNAQAIGSYYSSSQVSGYTGTMGHMGTCSFFPSKNLGCYGDGGAITTNDDALAGKIRKITNHGSSRRYYHDIVGVNSRLDNLQAAVLHAKLPLLSTYNQNRIKAAQMYNEKLADLPQAITPTISENLGHVFHQYTLRVLEDRDGLAASLQSQGISNVIYYPIPLHLQKAYKNLGYKTGDLPITEQASLEVLSLPMHSELNESTINLITDAIRSHYA